MTLFRFHREFLDDSLKTVIEVESKKQLESILGDTIRIESYGIDPRCGWDTYIVTDDLPVGENKAVYGFTNGDLK